jgi:acetyl esterase/lipase
MYIPACEKDPTFQESLFFYEECKKQGVDAEFQEWKGLPHFFWGIPTMKKSQDFMDVWCHKLNEMLAVPA